MSQITDDDDEFLYGTSEMEPKPTTNNLDIKSDVDDLYDLYEDNDVKDGDQKEEDAVQAKNGASPEKSNKDEEQTEVIEAVPEQKDEDEDSDDDLEIILEPEEEEHQQENEVEISTGEKAETTEATETPVNIKLGQQAQTNSATAANTTSSTNVSGTKSTQGGINLEAIGEYNGTAITEVDLDNVEDKPWRKPGADITDYFNYGFNELSWRAYCAKQKMLRENKKMMGDMDMGDLMSMCMMMPPNIMEGGMPMPIPGMPNPMMGLPIGMPPPQGAGNANMRNNRGPNNFNPKTQPRNMQINRSKNPDGKEHEGSNEMTDNTEEDNNNMFPMEFPGGPGGMPMNLFPPEMAGAPMGMPFFNPNMPVPPMGFDGNDFRGGSNPGRPSMRGGGHMSSISSIPRNHNNPNSSNNPSSNWRGSNSSGRESGRDSGRDRDSSRDTGREDSGRSRDRDRDSGRESSRRDRDKDRDSRTDGSRDSGRDRRDRDRDRDGRTDESRDSGRDRRDRDRDRDGRTDESRDSGRDRRDRDRDRDSRTDGSRDSGRERRDRDRDDSGDRRSDSRKRYQSDRDSSHDYNKRSRR